ncbi:hypothetical protein JCM11251_004582 [Rhodosporidiobolus azoricus]
MALAALRRWASKLEIKPFSLMSLLRAASRALAPSSCLSQTSLPALVSRSYSTEPSQPAQNPHTAQRAARTRSLRQVSEQGGAMGKLIDLAVRNTAQAGEQAGAMRQRREGQQQGQAQNRQRGEGNNGGAPRPPRSPRQRTPAAVDGALLEGSSEAPVRQQQQQQQQRRPRRSTDSTPRTNLGSSLSSRRSTPSSSEASALREGGFRSSTRPFPPRNRDGASPSSPAGGPRKPRAPLRPKQARPARPSLSASFSAEDTKPLDLPSSVRTPSANLARLLKDELARKTLQVKAAVGEKVVNEDAETAEAREAARKILGGDYSVWAEAGKEAANGSKGAEHARGILKLNPSVDIVGREALLSKVKEALS